MTHEHDKPRGWIGVDFDGTLANYTSWVDSTHVGAAIEPMVQRVRGWLAAGWEVRIFTARVYPLLIVAPLDEVTAAPRMFSHPFSEDSDRAVEAIRDWCARHHLAYDAEHHKRTAYATRKSAARTGDLFQPA